MSKKKAASGHITLHSAIETFIARYKDTSQETYRYNLEAFAAFIGSQRRIGDITPQHIHAYQKHVESRLKTKEIAPATYATYLRMLKIFFNWLVKTKQIETSPASLMKVPRTLSHVDKHKAMTDEELGKVLEKARWWSARDYALLLFFADTGCRAGGAAGLRVEHIDFDRMVAEVTEKGEKARLVAFEKKCADALRAWLKKRPKEASDYVFSPAAGKAETADSLSQVVRRSCRRAGVRSLGSHSLRHRKGHQLAYSMVPPTLAARIMGHESPDTTLNSYYPTTWDEADKIMRKLAVKDEPAPKPPVEQEKRGQWPRLTVLKRGG